MIDSIHQADSKARSLRFKVLFMSIVTICFCALAVDSYGERPSDNLIYTGPPHLTTLKGRFINLPSVVPQDLNVSISLVLLTQNINKELSVNEKGEFSLQWRKLFNKQHVLIYHKTLFHRQLVITGDTELELDFKMLTDSKREKSSSVATHAIKIKGVASNLNKQLLASNHIANRMFKISRDIWNVRRECWAESITATRLNKKHQISDEDMDKCIKEFQQVMHAGNGILSTIQDKELREFLTNELLNDYYKNMFMVLNRKNHPEYTHPIIAQALSHDSDIMSSSYRFYLSEFMSYLGLKYRKSEQPSLALSLAYLDFITQNNADTAFKSAYLKLKAKYTKTEDIYSTALPNGQTLSQAFPEYTRALPALTERHAMFEENAERYGAVKMDVASIQRRITNIESEKTKREYSYYTRTKEGTILREQLDSLSVNATEEMTRKLKANTPKISPKIKSIGEHTLYSDESLHSTDILSSLKTFANGKHLVAVLLNYNCYKCDKRLPAFQNTLDNLGNDKVEAFYLLYRIDMNQWVSLVKKHNLKGKSFLLTKDQSRQMMTSEVSSHFRLFVVGSNGDYHLDVPLISQYYLVKEERLKAFLDRL